MLLGYTPKPVQSEKREKYEKMKSIQTKKLKKKEMEKEKEKERTRTKTKVRNLLSHFDEEKAAFHVFFNLEIQASSRPQTIANKEL